MSITTTQLESIRDNAQDLVDTATELLELRDDPDSDPDDKSTANEAVDAAIESLVRYLPKNKMKAAI